MSRNIGHFVSRIASLPTSTLFPYTTLFRSRRGRTRPCGGRRGCRRGRRRRRPPRVAPSAALPCRKRWSPPRGPSPPPERARSEEHTSELQSRLHLVCRLLLEKKNGLGPIPR